jgi:hypothetical protein
VVTLPASAAVAFGVFRLTQLPTAAAWLVIGSMLLVGGGLVAYAMTHTITAADVDAEVPTEEELAEPLAGPPRLVGETPVE